MERKALGILAFLTSLGALDTEAAAITPSLSVNGCSYSSAGLVTADGRLYVWGENNYGKLGLGTLTAQYTTPQLTALTGVRQHAVSAQHSMVLMQDGTVRGAGYNIAGVLANGTATNSTNTSFTTVTGLTDVVQIDISGAGAIALKSDGTVWTWGSGLIVGQGGGSDRNQPVQVLSGAKAVASTCNANFALMNDGTVYSWGINYEGELGDPGFQNRYYPTLVAGLTNIKQIDTGQRHFVALSEDGTTIYSMGQGDYGALGLGTADDEITPQALVLPEVAARIVAGYTNTFVFAESGAVYASGENLADKFQLGDSSIKYALTLLPYPASLDLMAGLHLLKIERDGSVWGRGYSNYGVLGLGNTSAQLAWTQVESSSHWPVSLDPATADFGVVYRGSATPTASIEGTNLNGIGIELDFTEGVSAPFSNATVCVGGSFPSGWVCNMEFELDTGAAAGEYAADFALLNQNVLAGVQYIALSATLEEPLLDPDFAFDPTGPLAYGAKGLGQTRDEVISVLNQGGGSLNISRVTLSRGDFKLVANGCTGASLGAGDSCDMTVRFSPLGPGAKSATLSVTSNDATPVNTYRVTGTGARLQLSPDQRQLRFARTPLTLMPKPTQVLTLSNTGGADLDITNVSLASADFGITADTCDGTTLAPAASCTITVEFHPASTGSKRASLEITTSDPRRPNLSVALIGVGIN